MKKCLIFLMLIVFMSFIPFLSVRADFGPKRTLEIEIIGVERPYHIELLMVGTLPEDEKLDEIRIHLDEEYDDFPEMLYTFEFGGYVASNLILPWGSWHQSPRDNYFIYSYNPPTEFKIMLIFDDGTYVISRRMEPSLFNSKITYDLTGINLLINQTHVGRITEVFPIQTMTLELALRIIGTIIIEVLILFLFGYVKKYSYKLIIFVNLATQITLTGFMFAAKYFVYPVIGELFVLIFGEAMIFMSEALIYRFYLKEKTKNRAVIYAIVANLIALLASFSVMILMTNM